MGSRTWGGKQRRERMPHTGVYRDLVWHDPIYYELRMNRWTSKAQIEGLRGHHPRGNLPNLWFPDLGLYALLTFSATNFRCCVTISDVPEVDMRRAAPASVRESIGLGTTPKRNRPQDTVLYNEPRNIIRWALSHVAKRNRGTKRNSGGSLPSGFPLLSSFPSLSTEIE
jgi:hypothetical protein